MYQTSFSRLRSFILMSKLLLLLLLLPSARCSKLWSIQLVQKKTQQGRNSCPRLQFGFQFGLYHVVARLSFLRSISLASLFTSLSIFGWSDLLQTLRRQAAFSFAVLCIIIFNFSEKYEPRKADCLIKWLFLLMINQRDYELIPLVYNLWWADETQASLE